MNHRHLRVRGCMVERRSRPVSAAQAPLGEQRRLCVVRFGKTGSGETVMAVGDDPELLRLARTLGIPMRQLTDNLEGVPMEAMRTIWVMALKIADEVQSALATEYEGGPIPEEMRRDLQVITRRLIESASRGLDAAEGGN